MLSTGLVAIDSTIIATAVPSVVASIGGFTSFPWLFSVYVLAQAVSVPVYGKLADLFGRKPVMLFGIGLFLLGSVLCGVAWSMGALIAFRVVQGLGAGAVAPMTMTIAGDIYTIEERAKAQGYLASVWAISSVLGPTLGGVFSEYVSWRWIFFVNIPICLLAATMIYPQLHRNRSSGVQYASTISAPVCSARAAPWSSWPCSRAASHGRGLRRPDSSSRRSGPRCWSLSWLVERRVPEPVLPLWVFGRRLLLTTSLVSVAVGAMLLGLTSYVPTYVQDVLGTGPLVAGLAVGALTLGWPLSASQAGRIYTRIGFRYCALIGASIAICRLPVADPAQRLVRRRAGRGHLLPHRPRHGTGRGADPDRGPVQRGLERARRGDRRRTCSAARPAARSGSRSSAPSPTPRSDRIRHRPTRMRSPGRHCCTRPTTSLSGIAIAAAALVCGVLVIPRGSRTPGATAAVPVDAAADDAAEVLSP